MFVFAARFQSIKQSSPTVYCNCIKAAAPLISERAVISFGERELSQCTIYVHGLALCLHGRVWSQVTVIQLCTGYMAVFDHTHTRSTSTPLQIRPWTRRTSILSLSLAVGRARDEKCWQFGRFFAWSNGRKCITKGSLLILISSIFLLQTFPHTFWCL